MCLRVWRACSLSRRLLGFQLSAVVRATVPRVHVVLAEEGVSYDTLAAQLLLPLLTSSLPMPVAARVLELFLVEVLCCRLRTS